MLATLPAAELVADRGYDSRASIVIVAASGGTAHTTQRRVKLRRSVARDRYRKRPLVERYVCRLKLFHRITTRYDKLDPNFLAAVALASAGPWSKALECTP